MPKSRRHGKHFQPKKAGARPAPSTVNAAASAPASTVPAAPQAAVKVGARPVKGAAKAAPAGPKYPFIRGELRRIVVLSAAIFVILIIVSIFWH